MTDTQQARRSRTPLIVRISIAAVTTVTLAIIAGSVLASGPVDAAQGAPAEVAPPRDLHAAYTDYSVTREFTDASAATTWSTMNEAMQTNDRDAFLSHTAGEAREHLARWWDGTKRIGWKTGYIDPIEEIAQDMQVLLGVDFTFSASPLRGTGDEDAGLTMLHGFVYDITTEGSEDGLVITSLTPQHPMPWDDGEIYAVHNEHVVHYGLADERNLVDATADEAERTAKIALEAVQRLGGEVPQNGFVSGITDSDDRMNRWWGSTQHDDEFHVAGFMRPTKRPSMPKPYLDASVATGYGSSGGTVMLGPNSSDQRTRTFVHEFAHVLHYTAVPETYLFRNTTGSKASPRTSNIQAAWATTR